MAAQNQNNAQAAIFCTSTCRRRRSYSAILTAANPVALMSCSSHTESTALKQHRQQRQAAHALQHHQPSLRAPESTSDQAQVIKRLLPLAAMLLASCTAAAGPYPEVQITRCYDGDTCTSTTGEKIRLACIDTAELQGRNADPIPAKAARDYLRGYLKGKTITIRRIDTDRYGHTVAELFADDVNVQQQLVANGHAEVYSITIWIHKFISMDSHWHR